MDIPLLVPKKLYGVQRKGGIRTGGHVIVGLPGEDGKQALLEQTKALSLLPLTTLKLHQLQLIKGTRMAYEYERNPSDFHLYSVDEYIDVVIDYVEHLRPDLVVGAFHFPISQRAVACSRLGIEKSRVYRPLAETYVRA